MPVTPGPGPHTRASLESFYRTGSDLPWHRDDAAYARDPMHRARLDFLNDALAALTPNSLLDVGCGTGVFLRMDAARDARLRVGCDISENGFRRDDANILFAAGDAAALPFRDDAFDCAVCSETLEHLPEPAAALEEIRRVLKPGGTLLVTVPNLFCYDSIEGRLRVLKRLGTLLGRDLSVNTHLVKQLPDAWKKLFEDNGFRALRDAPIYTLPYIPYLFKPLKELEFALLGSAAAGRALAAWSRAVARVPLLRLTGQIHFFECRKEI